MSPAQPLLGFGQVRHRRARPRQHAFAYPNWFLLLPLRSMAQHGSGALAVNRRAAIAFHDVDHGDGRSPAEGGALAWLDALLHSQGIVDAQGEVWLHCYARVWGYAFKPVSFWYCHRSDNSLAAIVVEVNNTFGERHCYVLPDPHFGQSLHADKVFHVSPFCHVQGRYDFRFMRTERDGQTKTVVRIDHSDAAGLLISTSVSGSLQALTAQALQQALWRYPLQSFAVIARIHWQALGLWLKRVPFVRKPPPPAQFATRGGSST
jgi:hypothetical protein